MKLVIELNEKDYEVTKDYIDIGVGYCYLDNCMNAIKNGKPIESGEWIESDIPNEKYHCSVCGGACWYYDYQGYVAKSNFCPNCGADMRDDKE